MGRGFCLDLVGGRVIHAHGLLTEKSSHWVLGMQVTLFTRIGLALVDNMCGTILYPDGTYFLPAGPICFRLTP